MSASRLYQKLTNNTVVAYFPAANALYAGDRVQIMGLRVGAIDKIEPAGDKMKVTFHYLNKYKVPANASAVILNPTSGGLAGHPAGAALQGRPGDGRRRGDPGRTHPGPDRVGPAAQQHHQHHLPSWAPHPSSPKGPFGEVIESFADGLAGKGKQINTTLNSLSQALTALNQGRGDFFAVVRSLALFVNALHQDDQQFVALNQEPGGLHHTARALGQPTSPTRVQQFDGLLTTIRPVARPEPRRC